MNILAVDPGTTTGFALWVPGTGGPVIWQVEGREQAYIDGWAYLSAWKTTTVVERYVLPPKNLNSPQPDPFYVIGALEAFALSLGLEFVLQRPSDAVGPKTPYPNRVLKALGWYVPGTPHGLDATRHLAHYLLSQHGPEADRIMEAMLHG